MKTESFKDKYKIDLVSRSGRVPGISAVVDYSAACTCISFKIMRKLGFDEKELHPVSTIKADKVGMGFIVPLEVVSGGEKVNVEVVAVKNLRQKIILGRDFLFKIGRGHHCVINFLHLYNLIKHSKQRFVLIIGNDYEHFDMLFFIKRILRNFGYEGILLKQYPDIEEQSIEEKKNLFGSLARFVICENSFPSGHIDELNICTRNRLVTIILQDGKVKGGASLMQSCYPIDFSFVKRIYYSSSSFYYNSSSFISSIGKAVKIGESLVKLRKQLLNREYFYRKKWFSNLSEQKRGIK